MHHGDNLITIRHGGKTGGRAGMSPNTKLKGSFSRDGLEKIAAEADYDANKVAALYKISTRQLERMFQSSSCQLVSCLRCLCFLLLNPPNSSPVSEFPVPHSSLSDLIRPGPTIKNLFFTRRSAVSASSCQNPPSAFNTKLPNEPTNISPAYAHVKIAFLIFDISIP